MDELISLTDAKTPVLLDAETVNLVEQYNKNNSIKRLFEIVSNMDDVDIQAVVGLAERLFVTKSEH